MSLPPRDTPRSAAPSVTSGEDASAAAPDKSVFIKTYGCQMNVYDSQLMGDLLKPLGYRSVDAPDAADVVILNTCHIREKAAEKVYSELGRLRAMKEARGPDAAPPMTIVVAGCVAQAEGAEIQRRAPVVDVVLGPQSTHKLPEMIARAHRATGEKLAVDFDVEDKFDALPAARQSDGPAAFVSIQEGCDKFCTFCVVPYTRGAEFSRPVDQVVAEVRALAAQGVREVTLLGQNVNAYHGSPPRGRAGETGAPWGLGRLARHLAQIDGLARIRFTTSHPRDMDEDLIAAFADEPKLMPYLHLPVQSGSDRILHAMNRGHNAQRYLDLIQAVRAARPDIAISGDFIVGFPGESEGDFQDTLALVEAVGYAQAFSFKYSVRPGTPAAGLPGQVDEDDKSERLNRLQTRLSDQQTAFNRRQMGRILPILLEKPGKHAGQVHGRSPYLQAVHLPMGDRNIGDIVPVRITETTRNSLSGVPADDADDRSSRPSPTAPQSAAEAL